MQDTVYSFITMMGTLDATDIKILRLLQQDSSITNAALAKAIGLTPAPTFERVRRLEREGYIRRYVALVDPRKLGKPVTAFVSVILESHKLRNTVDFLNFMGKLPEVLECHHIAGDEDFLLKVVAASPEEYEHFVLDTLTKIGGIEKVKTTFVLSSSKSETAIPLPDLDKPLAKGARRRKAGSNP